MEAGQLNSRVNIEQRTSSVDSIGQPVETWSLVAAVWANVRHLSGVGVIKASADTSVVKASIRIRNRSGIDAGMRVTHDGKQYQIDAVMPDGKRQFIDIVCQQVA